MNTEKYFHFFCVCLNCRHKWIGSMTADTSAFTLECTDCGDADSFATLLTDEYLDEFKLGHNLEEKMH